MHKQRINTNSNHGFDQELPLTGQVKQTVVVNLAKAPGFVPLVPLGGHPSCGF
jgi:hypothetical protein